MKHYWIIQCAENDPSSGIKVNFSKNNLPLKPGDEFVVLCSRDNTSLQVGGIGKVKNILSIEEKKIPGKNLDKILSLNASMFVFYIESELNTTTQTIDIEDYRYSLQLFSNRSVLFKKRNQSFTKISKQDFTTLSEGKIFLARTAFGKLINALPSENKYDSIACIIKTFDTTDLRTISYKAALSYLFDFIDQGMKCSGEAIVASGQALTRILKNHEVPAEKIGIFDERENKERLILKQSEQIEQFLSKHQKLNLRTNIFAMIDEHLQDEATFERSFKNYNWPITL